MMDFCNYTATDSLTLTITQSVEHAMRALSEVASHMLPFLSTLARYCWADSEFLVACRFFNL